MLDMADSQQYRHHQPAESASGHESYWILLQCVGNFQLQLSYHAGISHDYVIQYLLSDTIWYILLFSQKYCLGILWISPIGLFSLMSLHN